MIPHIPEKNKAAVLSASRGSGFFAEMRQKSTGNTAQRASGDFARHLLANFPSYFTKMLVNTSSIHSAFCFI